jgi:hypothetical protein
VFCCGWRIVMRLTMDIIFQLVVSAWLRWALDMSDIESACGELRQIILTTTLNCWSEALLENHRHSAQNFSIRLLLLGLPHFYPRGTIRHAQHFTSNSLCAAHKSAILILLGCSARRIDKFSNFAWLERLVLLAIAHSGSSKPLGIFLGPFGAGNISLACGSSNVVRAPLVPTFQAPSL